MPLFSEAEPIVFDKSRHRPRIIVRVSYKEDGFLDFRKHRVRRKLIHLDFHKQDEKTGEIKSVGIEWYSRRIPSKKH